MQDRSNYMDDLIGKVLTGEATAQEKLEVDLWRKDAEANEKYFIQLKTVFEKASAVSVQLKFDEDAAWQKVKAQLKGGKQVYLKQENFSYISVLKIAASIIVVIAAGIFTYQWLSPAGTEVVAIKSERVVVNDTLPDGSVAVLNKQSEMQYEFNKKNNTRKVKLKGEAYFEVVHEETKPFLIETDEVLIKDIGTAFNVKAYPNSDTVEVYVESGEVQFYTLKNPGIYLKAGEIGIYNKSIKEFSRIAKLDTNALAYKTKIFCFNNTELQTAVEMLNSVYDSHIVLANKEIGHCRLTVNFNNDKIEDIVDIIAETMALTATRKEKEWVLDGAGCEK